VTTQYEIARNRAEYIQVADLVRVDLGSGRVTFLEGYDPDEAARVFWESVGIGYGRAVRDRVLQELEASGVDHSEEVRMIIRGER
jgi:hypothetical protein